MNRMIVEQQDIRRSARLAVPQDVQNGFPARPQVNQNRRRTLSGTLRIVASRERRWRALWTAD